MLLKFWKNRLEFFPYFSILFFWFFGCFLSSLLVKNRPGIVTLGLITIPSVILILIAIGRTYKELSIDISHENGRDK